MVFCFCDEFKFFLIATRIFLTEIMSLLYIQNPFGSCNRARCHGRAVTFRREVSSSLSPPLLPTRKKKPEAGKLDAQ
ncbi:hypothetical protein C0J52_12556 [Blattella germanica]|nr:hypothetical protein C0J52_12556 [Blattella germanica]